MIDTKTLETIIENAKSDGKLIHSAVQKVDKKPKYITFSVMRVDVDSDEARILVMMHWDVTHKLRTNTLYGMTASAMRFKWFHYMTERLSIHAKDALIDFSTDPKSFEFGVRMEGRPSYEDGSIVLWASCHIIATGIPTSSNS